jgi:hypothetical protein
MSRLSPEEIEAMFAEFGLAREEDRQSYRDLAALGSVEELTEQSIKIDSTTDIPSPRSGEGDAQLA